MGLPHWHSDSGSNLKCFLRLVLWCGSYRSSWLPTRAAHVWRRVAFLLVWDDKKKMKWNGPSPWLMDVRHSVPVKGCMSQIGPALCRVRILARVRESTLAKTPANESTRVQLDSCKLSDVSHKLNTGEFKDSCKLHPGESKWTLVALYETLPLLWKIGSTDFVKMCKKRCFF